MFVLSCLFCQVFLQCSLWASVHLALPCLALPCFAFITNHSFCHFLYRVFFSVIFSLLRHWKGWAGLGWDRVWCSVVQEAGLGWTCRLWVLSLLSGERGSTLSLTLPHLCAPMPSRMDSLNLHSLLLLHILPIHSASPSIHPSIRVVSVVLPCLASPAFPPTGVSDSNDSETFDSENETDNQKEDTDFSHPSCIRRSDGVAKREKSARLQERAAKRTRSSSQPSRWCVCVVELVVRREACPLV